MRSHVLLKTTLLNTMIIQQKPYKFDVKRTMLLPLAVNTYAAVDLCLYGAKNNFEGFL
jgi:hypothetical protein